MFIFPPVLRGWANRYAFVFQGGGGVTPHLWETVIGSRAFLVSLFFFIFLSEFSQARFSSVSFTLVEWGQRKMGKLLKEIRIKMCELEISKKSHLFIWKKFKIHFLLSVWGTFAWQHSHERWLLTLDALMTFVACSTWSFFFFNSSTNLKFGLRFYWFAKLVR